MRAARFLLVGLFVLGVSAACGGGGDGGLTAAEDAWCQDPQNQEQMLREWAITFDERTDNQQLRFQVTVLRVEGDFARARQIVQESFPSEYEQACRAAYENR